jgi:hypothetical protein
MFEAGVFGMKHSSRGSMWLLMLAAACLLVLSVLAPRAWRSILAPAIGWADELPLVAPLASGQAGAKVPTRLAELSESSRYSAPRQTADIAPPVADQFDFDMPLADVPVLPTAPRLPTAALTPQFDTPGAADSNQPAMIGSPSDIPKRPTEFIPAMATCWPYPASLIEQLTTLSTTPESREWATKVRREIDGLMQIESLAAPQSAQVFQRMQALADETKPLAEAVEFEGTRVGLLRAGYALSRRVAVWSQVHAIAAHSERPVTVVSAVFPNASDIRQSVADIESQLILLRYTDAWREFLLLDELIATADSPTTAVTERSNLARRILLRMETPKLTDAQRLIFQHPSLVRLNQQMRVWVSRPMDYLQLLDELERYERQSDTSRASFLSEVCQTLQWSGDESVAELARRIETHYRNANIRVAISGTLINRMLPEPQRMAEDVDDHILGARVFGRSEASTRLFVRLMPDRERLHMGLEAQGEVASETSASKGPATFFNEGLSRYRARKLLTIDQNGMRVWRSEADANSNVYLTGLNTGFDALPLISSLVRSFAMQQHESQSRLARSEVEGKLAGRASQRLDDHVHQKLEQAENEFQKKIYDPLDRLRLNPTAIDLETTEQRLIVRYRVAGHEQLAAHSPRPQAPSDSLLSVQTHETAVNNLIQQLKLDGKRAELRQLYREVAEQFGIEGGEVIDELPENVTIQFADREAVRVRYEDDRVMLVLKLAELSAGRGNHWRNFEVRAYFVPQTSGPNAMLVRDGYIELLGQRLGLRDQIALRGIFTKALSRNRPLSLIPQKIARDPRLQDLRINQFVIDDGWIGVALGPDRSPPAAPGSTSYEARTNGKATSPAR